MPPKKDRASAQGLLPLMEARPWKDGKTITYRYHPIGGKPINLGTDRNTAIRAVLDLNTKAKDQGTVGQLWRLYSESADYTALAEVTRKQYAEYWGGWRKCGIAASSPTSSLPTSPSICACTARTLAPLPTGK